ncbi:MAG: M56 family metallopeptidase [Clostridium sp.]|uniref:M56 family metallopeptidase n=1 Tax=Clostridium sp. TaxID=1506 RepID=UPI00301E9CFD
MIEKLFLTFIEITLTTSIIILPLLLFSSKLKKIYTSTWRYILWLVIIVRLIIPLNLNLPKSPINITVPKQLESTAYNFTVNTTSDKSNVLDFKNTSDKSTSIDTNINSSKIATPIEEKSLTPIDITPLKLISILWLIGVLSFIIYQFINYFIFRKITLRWSTPVTDKKILDILKNLCSDMAIKKSIKIMTCKKVASPMLLGLLKPMIILPTKNLNSDDLSVILKHELTHLKCHDISYKLIMNTSTALHWFNPLIYLMVKETSKDIEFHCDDLVIRNMDTAYKAKYSDAILAAMHYNPNYNTIFSTNFNGDVETMKMRFKNIFDTNKKHKGISALCIILSMILVSSSLVACHKTKKSSTEDTAKAFLKGYYEIKDYDILAEYDVVIEDATKNKKYKYPITTGVPQFTDEVDGKIRNIFLKQINDYMTVDAGTNLILNRYVPKNIVIAKEFGYTVEVKELTLGDAGNNQLIKDYYNYFYSAKIILTYEDGNVEEQVLDGNISLKKENEKWLVSSFKETNGLVPNKNYYKPSNDNSSNSQNENINDVNSNTSFATPQELCDAYMQAMLDSDYSFIGGHTANSINSTSLAEGQKTWDTIKIQDVKIVESEVRDTKAWYELEFNVTDPGTSAFDKGPTGRWLYISSITKNNVVYWYVEGLNSGGKPDENWWKLMLGG